MRKPLTPEQRTRKNELARVRYHADIETHREKSRKRMAHWAANNRETISARGRVAYQANPDRYRAAAKKWRAANPDKAKASANSWSLRNKDRISDYYKRRYAENADYYLRRAREWR